MTQHVNDVVRLRYHRNVLRVIFTQSLESNLMRRGGAVNQSEINISLCQPIRDYTVCFNQSEISIVLCYPIRVDCLPGAAEEYECLVVILQSTS